MKQKCLNGGSVPSTHTHRLTIHRSSYLFIIMLFALMLKVDVGWGQGGCEPTCVELIDNSELKIKTGATSGGDAYSFPNSLIERWRCSHGTPHFFGITSSNFCYISAPNGGYSTLDQFPNNITCVVTQSFGSSEGFYQILKKPIKDDPYLTYTVRMRAGLMPCSGPGNWPTTSGSLVVRFANHLNQNANCGNVPPPFDPISNPSQIVFNSLLTTNSITTFTREFNHSDLTSDFNQIWLYSSEGPTTNLGIYDVAMSCRSSALTGVNTVSSQCTQYSFEPLEERPFESYEWCVNNVKISDTKNFNYDFGAPGPYEVCLKGIDINCCCAQECITVNVACPTPDATFTFIDDCPNFQFFVSNPNECDSYKWEFGDGTSSESQNPIYTYTNTGTYTVRLTVMNCGQISTTTQQVVINCQKPNCADSGNCKSIGTPGGTVLLSSLIAGPNPLIPHYLWFGAPVIENQCFNLEGTLEIDVWGAFFVNTTWYCGPGSTIKLKDFGAWGSHWFIDSQLLGCSTMWKGIVLEPNPLGNFFVGGLGLRNTTIYDAYRGVELAGGRAINAEGSAFINNYVGSYVPANGFNFFKDCRFENTSAMLPPYPGQPIWKSRMHAGIEGNNNSRIHVTGTEGNSRSIFKNLTHGIKTYQSGISVDISKFEIDDVTENDLYISYGILESTATGSSILNNCEFVGDLQIGINSYNGSAHQFQVSGCLFNIESSFRSNTCIGNSRSTNVSIEIINSNVFNLRGYGGSAINLSNCNYSNLKIDENNFNIFWDKSWSFVNIQTCVPSSGFGLIRENIFDGVGSDGSIGLNNSPRIVVLKNQSLNKGVRYLQTNSDNHFYSGNTDQITNSATAFISNKNSFNSRYCCNISNAPVWSFIFEGDGNFNSRIIGNELYSLRLKGGTIIGLQPSHGNVFNVGSSLAHARDYTGSDYFLSNQFRVDPNQLGFKPTNVDPSQYESEWFSTDGLSNSCGNFSTCNTADFELPFVDPDSIPLARMAQIITEDEADLILSNYFNSDRVFNNEQYPNRYRHIWENHYHLYQQIQKHPYIDWNTKLNSLESGNILIENLTQGMINWADVEDRRAKLYEMTNNQWIIFHQNQKVLKDVGVLIKNWYTDTSPDKDPNILTSLHNQLNDAQHIIKEIGNEINSSVLEAMVSLSAEIDALDESLPFLAERKKVWQIDAIRIVSGLASITNAEWAEIERIAALCPLEYGSAVYEAHGLLVAKGDTDSSFDFEQNCVPFAENRLKSTTQARDIDIFPNPTTGLIHINFANNNLADKFILSNLLGQKIYEYMIPENQIQLDLELNQLDNGVYLYNIMSKNQTIQTGKLIFID